MKFTSVSLIAVLASVASALTQADTSKAPSGNSIYHPGLNEQVPVGTPYEITWNPTTSGKVSIVLLRGPSDAVVPISTIADSVTNTGQFTWTPASSLENDVTHYGIEIIVEGTGQYQYSTQFGIKNDKSSTHASSTPAASTPKAHGQVPSSTSTLTLRPATSTAAAQPTPEAPSPASAAPVVSQSPVEQAPAPEPTQPAVTPVQSIVPTPATPAAAPYSTGGTMRIFPTASNYPVPKQSGLPFDYSSGAASNSIAFGSIAMGALAVFAF